MAMRFRFPVSPPDGVLNVAKNPPGSGLWELELDETLSGTATRVFKIAELRESETLKKIRERFEEAAQTVAATIALSK